MEDQLGKHWEIGDPSSVYGRLPQMQLSTEPRTDSERSEILERRIIEATKLGWKVQHQSSFFAALARGKKPNHILHLLLSIFTLGLWLPVWFILGMSMREKIETIEIDKFGNTIYR